MENDFGEILLSALDEGNDIIYLSDPENYKLYYLNKTAKNALGNPPRTQWFEKPCYQVLHGSESPCNFCPCPRLSDQVQKWECFSKKMGKHLHGKSLAVESGNRIFQVGIAANITKQVELENRINYLNKMDELTGAGNRRSYLDRLSRIDECESGGIGILVTDIDRLRDVNDAYGCQWGDFILIHTAEVLKSIFGEELYRIGEDEFMAFGTDMDEARFESVVKELTERAKWDEQFQVSLGASYYDGERDIEYHISAANEKMNLAKLYHYSESEDQILEGTPSENGGKYQTVRSEKLKAEIQGERFQLFLQPQISLKSGEIGGAEALVRYIDEKGNIIYPNAFIDKYETEGLIRYIDMYMLEGVCRLLAKWQLSGKQKLNISVNFSRVTLIEDNIVKKMKTICEKHKVPPSMVKIEITESVGVLGRRELEHLLISLQRAGFSISLDDFGSRYSDLAILSIANFDEIKLDKSLVDKIESKGKSRTIAEYILHMCMDLELTHTVAEGIETVPQREIFKQYGCELGQGYLFDRPMPVEDFERKYILS